MPKIKPSEIAGNFNGRCLDWTLVAACVLTLSSCAKTAATTTAAPEMIKPTAPPAGFMTAGDSDPELIEVKEKAQKELGQFTAAFAKKTPGEQFMIKAPFREGAYEEHKWVIVDAVKKDEMDGHIERPSQTIKHLKVGQVITVNDYNIEDWAYLDKDKVQHGGWSVEVLRKREGSAAH
jgi:uncharacterized protein YegJ (DUF2314 family)